MTIYSQHPNRGKVQILATFRGPAGVVSSTITSVEDAALARPIVDALNRISACATVPVSVWDTRDDRHARYPREHLAALTDRTARADLLEGAHSLWYEQAKALLHEALADLDEATAVVPPPVGKAIAAELEAEVRGLDAAWTEYSEGVSAPEMESERCWDFQSPFVAFEGGVEGLSGEDRDRLNRLEHGATADEIRQGVEDMRLLQDAYRQTVNDAIVLLSEFSITDDPLGPSRYYLNVEAPRPNGEYGHVDWEVEIGQWDVDLDDPEHEDSTAHGNSVLRCTRSTRPAIAEIIELLNHSGGRQEQLAAWAKTPVGEALAGTTFVVTKRFDE
ncbi:hypothetical protein ACFOWZ_41515 [Lentzea rhizosphaerae]|uniref:Uncharacterized protein n=1 Tax=Lentzea rhizosphaerae TaxID=2041025 RepID=A0ABV8C8F2_9PSEU